MLNKEYFEHKIFEQLNEYVSFYDNLSYSVMGFITSGTRAKFNIDTYVYTSIKGTLESIKDVLWKGRISDSYALLRRYYDSTIINIYTNHYLDDNFSLDNFTVTKIDNWLKGVEPIPEYKQMSQYIRSSSKLKAITDLLLKDKTYKEIRDRCNAHTHYNFFHHLMINDNEIYDINRFSTLDKFYTDLDDIFVQHFAYIFSLKGQYMSSSDYIDSLEMGLLPEEGSQYFVAPFIQNIFDKVIKVKRPDLANEIKSQTFMQLS